MQTAYICDAVRTPIGRYGGLLSGIRTDDLGALPIKALLERNPNVEWSQLDEVIYGCANQSGEDNRNVARMSALLAGLEIDVPGITINRLCASGLSAVGMAATLIRAGEGELFVAGGVESMSRAPMVLAKADSAFSRKAEIYDTTLGWRFVNPRMRDAHGVDSMAQTADNVSEKYKINRKDQDLFALRSQQRWSKQHKTPDFKQEIIPVSIMRRKEEITMDTDEHPRPQSTIEQLAKLKGINGPQHSVTAGNASGINDGACALLIASEECVKRYSLKPKARVLGTAAAGVAPRYMGIGPIPASAKLLDRAKLSIKDIDIIELNEAFAAQALAVTRAWKLPDDADHVNACGGAIAMGHPLGMSGARLATTAMYQLQSTKGRYALCTMCVGVGQGVALLMERV
jgi:3-oxoadipyl-CoA thiolase